MPMAIAPRLIHRCVARLHASQLMTLWIVSVLVFVSAPTCLTVSVMLMGRSACKAAWMPRRVLVRLAKHCMADTAAGQSG